MRCENIPQNKEVREFCTSTEVGGSLWALNQFVFHCFVLREPLAVNRRTQQSCCPRNYLRNSQFDKVGPQIGSLRCFFERVSHACMHKSSLCYCQPVNFCVALLAGGRRLVCAIQELRLYFAICQVLRSCWTLFQCSAFHI